MLMLTQPITACWKYFPVPEYYIMSLTSFSSLSSGSYVCRCDEPLRTRDILYMSILCEKVVRVYDGKWFGGNRIATRGTSVAKERRKGKRLN